MKQQPIYNQDVLFEQMTAISKAGAYDAIAPDYARVKEENEKLRARVKYLEDLIVEYTGKMKVNLSGSKVDSFLKEQVKEYNWSEIEKEITDELDQYHEIKNRNEQDDLKDVL